MNEKKKLSLILAIVLAIIATVIIGSIIDNNKSNKIYKEIETTYNEKETNIIYLGRDDCGYCQMFDPVISNLSKTYNFDYTYININKLTNSDLEKTIELLNIDVSLFGTPYVVISENGKEVKNQIGYTDELTLFNLLQNNGIISEDTSNPYLADDSNEVVAAFNKVFSSSKPKVVYIGRPSCGYCTKFSPILEEVSEEYDFEYYYINSDEIAEIELVTILTKLGVSTSSFGTPYLAVVQNNEVKGEQPGYVEKESLIEFLEEYDIIN